MGQGTLLDRVHEALATVIDPELGLPITDLGLVYDVVIEDGTVRVTITTTTPICPLGDYLAEMTRGRLADLPGIDDVEVRLTHDPPWTPDRLSDRARHLLSHHR